MTNAEAIEILKSRRMCAAYVDSKYVDIVDIDAIDMAISALEKQEQKKTLTHADRVRAMNDEELAESMADILCEVIDKLNDMCYEKFKYSREQLVKGYLDWLKQEVKDNG